VVVDNEELALDEECMCVCERGGGRDCVKRELMDKGISWAKETKEMAKRKSSR